MHLSASTTPPQEDPLEHDVLNIAMLAPPWIPVPPPAYGGIEQVIELLAGELTRRGHRVTLFAAPGSRSPAAVHEILEHTHPDEIQVAIKGNQVTIADYFGAGLVTLGEVIRCDFSAYPNVQRWLANMKKQPSWAKVNEAFYGLCDAVKAQQFHAI